MKIAIIGGRRKNLTQFCKIAEDNGHELQSNELVGHSTPEVRRLVARADLVVILTDINSHNAMLAAKTCAKTLGRPTLIVKQMGATRFRVLLQAIARRTDLGWPWPAAGLEFDSVLSQAS
jgi:hypothetical protein